MRRNTNPKTRRNRKVNEIQNQNPQQESEVTEKPGKGFYACYLLTSLCPRFKGHTYIGSVFNSFVDVDMSWFMGQYDLCFSFCYRPISWNPILVPKFFAFWVSCEGYDWLVVLRLIAFIEFFLVIHHLKLNFNCEVCCFLGFSICDSKKELLFKMLG